MARTSKFDEELLVLAVVSYASVTPNGLLKANDIARWANINIEGLEGVQGYHFTRPHLQRDGTVIDRFCKQKIDEINHVRRVEKEYQRAANPILSDVAVEKFFCSSVSEQRKMLCDANQQYKANIKDLANARKVCESLKTELANEKNVAAELRSKMEKLLETSRTSHAKYEKVCRYLLRQLDENGQRASLATIGIDDMRISLSQYMRVLEDENKQMFDIKQALKRYDELGIGEDKSAEENSDQDKESDVDIYMNSVFE